VKKNILKLLIVGLFWFCISIQNASGNSFLPSCNAMVINTIMEDLFPVPQATRIHAYTNLAAYQVLAKNPSSTIKPLRNGINDWLNFPEPTSKNINYDIAAELTFLNIAKMLLYSENIAEEYKQNQITLWKSLFADTTILYNSIVYADTCTAIMKRWIKKDNYDSTRTMMRYQLSKSQSGWQPTAPEYMNALEPNWKYMRHIVSAPIPKVKPNIAFSTNKKSKYYQNALEVFTISKNIDSAKKDIALYWDDNPKTAVNSGHNSYFIHKATPAGHWLKIASQLCNTMAWDNEKTAEAYTYLCIAQYESILGCWTEKYNSNAMRPETFIHRYISTSFTPFIETPSFPEYTSGHSTLSAASATILAAFAKDNSYAFADSSQLYLQMPVKYYASFWQAAEEASISRLYGGIHYKPALQNGLMHGKEIGICVLQNLKK
jgi:hypothetical protein